jgi:hypothetical protein
MGKAKPLAAAILGLTIPFFVATHSFAATEEDMAEIENECMNEAEEQGIPEEELSEFLDSCMGAKTEASGEESEEK